MDGRTRATMEAHYAALSREGGHSARCDMPLPEGLLGKRVLDLGCRGGKGAFKIADAVGPEGFVLGVDPSAEFIARAASRAADRDASAERASRLAFARGCFEDLRAAGAADASFDVVVVNSVLNLAWDLRSALREIARVLVPGGLLFHKGVFARRPAHAGANAAPPAGPGASGEFARALDRASFEALVLGAGFATCRFGPPSPAEGADAGSFYAAVVRAETPS